MTVSLIALFALKEIKLFLDQTIGVEPVEMLHLLDLWKLLGRFWTLSWSCIICVFQPSSQYIFIRDPICIRPKCTDRIPVRLLTKSPQDLVSNLIHSDSDSNLCFLKKVIYFLIIPCLAYTCSTIIFMSVHCNQL